jgi:hypothetical protein
VVEFVSKLTPEALAQLEELRRGSGDSSNPARRDQFH